MKAFKEHLYTKEELEEAIDGRTLYVAEIEWDPDDEDLDYDWDDGPQYILAKSTYEVNNVLRWDVGIDSDSMAVCDQIREFDWLNDKWDYEWEDHAIVWGNYYKGMKDVSILMLKQYQQILKDEYALQQEVALKQLNLVFP